MQTNSTIKARLNEFLKHEGIGQAKFAEKVGLSRGFANNVGDSIRAENLSKISDTYPELNIVWLQTGEGEMLKGSASDSEDKTVISTGKVIPYYDAEVAAGTSYGMDMTPGRPSGMIEIGGLMKDSEFALRVYGNSMTPNYPSGCVIGLKPHTDNFIEPGTVYVVETTDNRYLKRLYYSKDKSAFRCISDNTMKHENGPMTGEYYYQEFEIPLSDISRLLRVTGVIKRNIL